MCKKHYLKIYAIVQVLECQARLDSGIPPLFMNIG